LSHDLWDVVRGVWELDALAVLETPRGIARLKTINVCP
jgi:hypothetical protein